MLIIVTAPALAIDVRLQALVEVVSAHASNDDGDNEQQDGEDGEAGERLAGGHVVLEASRARDVHADELEQEVGQGDEVDDDDDNHADDGLTAHPPCGEEEQHKGDGEGGGSQCELNVARVFDDDQELDGKGQEEEKVELEQGNVNLGEAVSKARTTEGAGASSRTW